MKSSTVRSSFVYAKNRFDGKYHLSDGFSVRRIIANCPYGNTLIRDITDDIYCPGIFKRTYLKSGVMFLGGGDIQKAEITSDKFLSKSKTPNWEILAIKKGWTLVTCGGTIGDTAFANKILEKCWISQHVMRVIPSNRIKEGMLYSYLASKYGKLLLTTGTYGSVIPTLSSENIAELPIPLFPESFQTTVDALIQSSSLNREKAASLLEEANSVLEEYLKSGFHKEEFKTEAISSKRIISSLQYRLDPPAIINDGVKTMQSLTSLYPYKLIRDIDCKVYRPGIFKRNYVANGIPYIKGSEIFLASPFRRCEHLSRTRTPFIDEMSLKEGQILITCAGSVGDIKMITKEYEEKSSIGSQDIIRLESSDNLFTKEFLFTYLQQPFVYDYIQSMKYGSVIERVEPFHIESIPVITPSPEVSTKITNIIKEYMRCMYNAFSEEEKAIKLVENEIDTWKTKDN